MGIAPREMEGRTRIWSQGTATAGLFQATMDISPATGFLFLLNFNVLWHHVQSSVSVIDTVAMTEIAEIEPGVIPYRSRLSRDAMLVHSAAMLSGAPTCRSDFMDSASACFGIASWTGRSRTPGPAPGP